MVTIAHASISENGTVKGEKGDQTKKEVCLRKWYDKPFNVVIRFNDPDMREKVAYAMERACANDNWGYSQYDRNSGLNACRSLNYDPGLVTKPVNCDCSSLITIACIYAGIAECALVKGGNCATTRTLKSLLKATGEVTIFTSSEYTRKTDKLLRGDILLAEGSHVVAVVKDEQPKKSVTEIAREVLQGKWGNGAVRQAKLQAAGYDYYEVQRVVKELIHGTEPKNEIKEEDRPRYIWNYLYGRIQNPYGVAGLMGNLRAESNLNPKNMQNSYEKKLGMNDESYTKCTDNGSYKHFCTDKVGYGLAQWTSDGRKAALYNSRGTRSIGDLDMQLEFLWKELSTSYKGVLNGLKVADSVREASDLVLTKFERPKDQSVAVQVKRASYGEAFYNMFFPK